MEKGRIKKIVSSIDYKSTLSFFDERAKKYRDDNPYAVTMYQDDNPDIVEKRNCAELKVLLPKLKLSKESVVLDLACGIGRWSDAIKCEIKKYYGFDFCNEFINLAKKRNDKTNRFFIQGGVQDIKANFEKRNLCKANKVLMIGILMYLNDDELNNLFIDIMECVDSNTTIVIREPIGIVDRLTLENFYSEELESNYSAIYRTRDEYVGFFNDTLYKSSFKIIDEGFLFESESLNNRKETAQYYFVISRKI